MQTSVEFLLSHMWTTDWINYTREEKLKVINQAKEMEKQQIIDAYKEGEDNVDNDGCTISKNGAESYFAETYGSKGSDETKTN